MTPPSNSICYLICVFNDQQGVEATLHSVFQDDPLADILIVDDGSQPAVALPEIPQGYNVILHALPENKGLIAALNEGLEYITSRDYQYIARLDAGDTVEKGRLKAQYDYLEQHSDIGMVGTQLRAFDKTTGETLFHFNNPTGAQKVSNVLKTKNCLAHPSIMARADIFKQVGFYDPDFKYAEDYEMWRRINRVSKVDNLPDVYVNKEISPNQMTATNRSGSNMSKLRAQLKYFELLDIWCWAGVVRTIGALLTPRSVLLFFKSDGAS